METETYNGWTNYETWAVALWIDNDHGLHTCWREAAAEARQEAPNCRQVTEQIWTADSAARFLLADWLREEITDAAPLDEPNLYTDLLIAALGEVNWLEIADHLLTATPSSLILNRTCACGRMSAKSSRTLASAFQLQLNFHTSARQPECFIENMTCHIFGKAPCHIIGHPLNLTIIFFDIKSCVYSMLV